MNERIEQMMLEATKDMPQGYYVPGEYFQKFAELIIREYSYDVMDLTAAPEHVAMAARHWGIEL